VGRTAVEVDVAEIPDDYCAFFYCICDYRSILIALHEQKQCQYLEIMTHALFQNLATQLHPPPPYLPLVVE
jgi:hypothetical protein